MSVNPEQSDEDAELIDFQHKRIYNQYLHERELITSLRNTELFRITILGVVATCWITVFLALFGVFHEAERDIALLLIFLLSLFIGNLLSFYAPLLIFHFKSSRLADKFVVNDRKNILDEDFISNKAEMQKNDIELWKRRMEQTRKYTSNTSKRLQKSEFRYYLFISFSILTIFCMGSAALIKIHFQTFSSQILIVIILVLSILLLMVIFVSDFPEQIRNIRRVHNQRRNILIIQSITPEFSKDKNELYLSGVAKSKYSKLLLWLCTADTLLRQDVIEIDEKSGKYEHKITDKLGDNLIPGTHCYGILVMSGTKKEQKVQLFRDSQGFQYIAEVIGKGNVDIVSEIELSRDMKARSLPQKICSLLDDADDDIYVKFSFIYNPENE